MKFGLEDLRTERQSRAAIGMDKDMAKNNFPTSN